MGKLAFILSIIADPGMANPDIYHAGITYRGKCSWFVADAGSSLMNAAGIKSAPEAYCACRWNEECLRRELDIPKNKLREVLFSDFRMEVLNPANGRKIVVVPVDTGPRRSTGRAIDLDKGSLKALGAKTDDELLFTLVRR